MTHAMLFTGVDVVDGKPRRWRVENSWGEDSGQKGYYTMNDSWYDEYMFEIAAPKEYLTEKMLAGLESEPIVLLHGTRWVHSPDEPANGQLNSEPDVRAQAEEGNLLPCSVVD